jgi:hypothetical protein
MESEPITAVRENVSIKAALALDALSFGGANATSARAADTEWSVNDITLKAAWKISQAASRPAQGDRVKVARIAGGVTHRTELPLDHPRIRLNEGANFYDPEHTGNLALDPMDAGPIDVLKTWLIPLNGHGAGKLSVFFSGTSMGSSSSGTGGSKLATGTAPKVTAVPIRVSPAVTHWNLTRMVRGNCHAHEAGCQRVWKRRPLAKPSRRRPRRMSSRR